MKAKEYLERKRAAIKAASEAAKPPAFLIKDRPHFTCKVGAEGELVLSGTCPAEHAVALGRWVIDTFGE